MTIKDVIEHNRTTVAYIRQHDFSSALESSASSLLLLNQLDSAGGGDSSAAEGSVTLDCLDQCMLILEVVDKGIDNGSNNTRALFIYDLGILLPPTVTGAEYTTMVSAVVFFNSALAHQLYAQEQSDKDFAQQYLQISRRLYGLAHGVHSRACHSTLFQFVVINNIAMIDQETGNVEQSTHYFKQLMTVFLLMMDQGCTSRLRHLRGFIRNAPFATRNSTAVAA